MHRRVKRGEEGSQKGLERQTDVLRYSGIQIHGGGQVALNRCVPCFVSRQKVRPPPNPFCAPWEALCMPVVFRWGNDSIGDVLAISLRHTFCP